AGAGLDWAALLKRHPAPPGKHRDLQAIRRALTEELPGLLDARERFIRRRALDAERQAWIDALAPFSDDPRVEALERALESSDRYAYADAYDRIARAGRILPDLRRRDALLAAIEPLAPAWARALRERAESHASGQVPGAGDPEAAWAYRRW